MSLAQRPGEVKLKWLAAGHDGEKNSGADKRSDEDSEKDGRLPDTCSSSLEIQT